MPLEVQYYVYGRIQKDEVDVTSKWVYAEDVGTASGQTDDSGYYYINLQDIANNGNSQNIYFEEDAHTWNKTFTLDISQQDKELNFDIYPDSTRLYNTDVLLGSIDNELNSNQDILTSNKDLEISVLQDLLSLKEKDNSELIDIVSKELDLTRKDLIDTLISYEDSEIINVIDLMIQNSNITKNELIDLLSKSTLTNNETLDILINEDNIIINQLMDVIQLEEYDLNYLIDNIIKKTNIERKEIIDVLIKNIVDLPHLVDLLIKNEGLDKSYKTDILQINKDKTINNLIDLYVTSRLDINSLIDILINNKDITKNNIIDLLLGLVITKSFKLDILISNKEVTLNNTIDLLIQLMRQREYDIDIIMKELNNSMNKNIDTLLSNKNLDTSNLIDSFIEKLNTANYNIDYSTWVSKTKHHKVGLVIGGENIMNHLIDYINKYNVIRNNLIDILTKDSDNSKSYLIDLYLKKKYTLAYDIGLLTEYKNLSNRELIDIVVRSNIQEMVLHQLLDGLIQNGNLTRNELMDILSFEMNKQRGTISDIFIGKLMFHWFINECDDWNEGDYSLNTSCDDGRLIVNV